MKDFKKILLAGKKFF